MTVFLAVIGVLGVSASGPIMAATAAPALAIAFWRNALGAVVMGAPALVRNPGGFSRLTRAETRWTALAAVALALHFACFITALQLTSVAAATALVCLQAGWIALFNLFRGSPSHRGCWPGWAPPWPESSSSPALTLRCPARR